MLEKHEVCCGIFHGFDWRLWTKGKPAQRLRLLPSAQEHVLAQDGGKERLLAAVTARSKAFALSVPHEEAIRIRDGDRPAAGGAVVRLLDAGGVTM